MKPYDGVINLRLFQVPGRATRDTIDLVDSRQGYWLYSEVHMSLFIVTSETHIHMTEGLDDR